jgi:hypothetical protein
LGCLTEKETLTGTSNNSGGNPSGPRQDSAGTVFQPPDQAGGVVKPRRSRAFYLWLTVIGLVLVSLWLATTRGTCPGYNLLLEGSSDCLGADVFVDGRPVGKMERPAGSVLNTPLFRLACPDGSHSVDVKKAGFQTFHTTIHMSGEDYLAVELKPGAP